MADFYTDVIKKSTVFHQASPVNYLALLEPITRVKVLAILSDAAKHNVKLHVQETYRSQALQEKYFREGNTKIRTVGVHHYGLAADIVPLDGHGNPTWDYERYHEAYDLIEHLAKAHDLVSGVDWGHPERKHKFQDRPHVQRCRLEDQDKLFAGTWYPDEKYSPYNNA